MTANGAENLPLTPPAPLPPDVQGEGGSTPHPNARHAEERSISPGGRLWSDSADPRIGERAFVPQDDDGRGAVHSPGGTSVTQPWTSSPGRRGREESFDRTTPLIEVAGLEQVFDTPAGKVYAVNGVDFAIAPGEAVGLVGESGSGKSTVAKCLVRLQEPSGGTIRFQGRDVTHLSDGEFRPLRSKIQMVFQDPTMSLNPRLSVKQTLAEPLKVHGISRGGKDLENRILELMDHVNLERKLINRQPGELSGGQKQRVGIARAIATRPELVILDEPTSSLDMSIRIQIIALLQRLQKELGMAYLFISHDLSTVRYLCSRVLVMYLGQVVEEGPVEEIFTNPKHPYTQALLSAVPIPDPALRQSRQRIVLPGETPHLHAPVVGCPLADRCAFVEPSHRVGRIPMIEIGSGGHRVACLLYQNGADETVPHHFNRAEPSAAGSHL